MASPAVAGAIAQILQSGFKDAREQRAKVAAIERAASLFSGTGTEEGQRFAAMIAEDPKRAAVMAEQFGGFGPLYNGIVSRQHQNRLAQLGVVNDNDVSKQFADAIRPITDAKGNPVPRDPEEIAAHRAAYENYVTNSGVADPALKAAGWARIEAQASGGAAAQAEDVANRERAFGQQLAAQSHSSALAAGNIRLSDSLQSAENQRTEAARQAEFDRQRAAVAADAERAKFIEDATALVAADPTQTEEVYNRTLSKFHGTDAFEVATQIDMGKKTAVAKALGTIAPLLADGADPRVAQLVLDNRAFKDPLSGEYVEGEAAERTNSGTRKALYQILTETQFAAEQFAKEMSAKGGSTNAFTGTIEQLLAKTGGDASPYYAIFDTFNRNAESLITKARTGAALNEKEMENYAQMMAKVGQIRLKNGKLDPAANARFESLLRVIENESMGRLPIEKTEAARKKIRAARQLFRSDFENNWKSVVGSSGAGVAQSRLDDIIGGSDAD